VPLRPDASPPFKSWPPTLFWRWGLCIYLSWILCPIRYGSPRDTIDNTWLFALNWAAAHHLLSGRDIVWTYGPLAYLLTPFDVGSNLAQGLIFQSVLWILLIVTLWDLLVRSDLPVRNLQLFSIFLALSAANYSQGPYAGNLLLPLALILLVHFRLRGGIVRYISALWLLGLLPLFQLVGIIAVLGILTGFIFDRLLTRSPGAFKEAALALFVPLSVALFTNRIVEGSFDGPFGYIKSTRELARGYVLAMSTPGTREQLVFILLAIILLFAVFGLLAYAYRAAAQFLTLILALPFIFALRHGLVRQDFWHVTQFFCFVALALALISLSVPFERRFVETVAVAVLFSFSYLWWGTVAQRSFPSAASSLSGSRVPGLLWRSLHYPSLTHSLRAAAQQNVREFGLEPEIRAIVGDQSVGFLSPTYDYALGDHLNLSLFPVLQNYSAYTPYLDQLNAEWVTSHGPRFLLFENLAVDDRNMWTETPATWAAVYRWYGTRTLGKRFLLLERRKQPRFDHFQPTASATVGFGETIPIPKSTELFFWTTHCSLNPQGELRALLLWVPEVTMAVQLENGQKATFRSLMQDGPSPGNPFPINFAQLRQLFDDRPDSGSFAQTLQFGGPGASSFHKTCLLQFWRPAN